MSAKEILEEVLERYSSIKEILDAARKSIPCGDRTFNTKIFPPDKFEKTTKSQDKYKIINSYFDDLNHDLAEHYILDIITTFERIVFMRIDNAYGKIKAIVTEKYPRLKKTGDAPLSRSAASFIKTKEDFHSLGGVKTILEKQIPEALFGQLKEIIEHRNWLSHGKRPDVGKESLLTIEEIHKILQNIIDEIRK